MPRLPAMCADIATGTTSRSRRVPAGVIRCLSRAGCTFARPRLFEIGVQRLEIGIVLRRGVAEKVLELPRVTAQVVVLAQHDLAAPAVLGVLVAERIDAQSGRSLISLPYCSMRRWERSHEVSSERPSIG